MFDDRYFHVSRFSNVGFMYRYSLTWVTFYTLNVLSFTSPTSYSVDQILRCTLEINFNSNLLALFQSVFGSLYYFYRELTVRSPAIFYCWFVAIVECNIASGQITFLWYRMSLTFDNGMCLEDLIHNWVSLE